jgi:hypothetical protein
MRKHALAGGSQALDGVDLLVGNLRETIPSFPQHAHEPSHAANLQIRRLVERMVDEQLAGEHWHPNEMLDASAAGPHVDFRQQRAEAQTDQLIVYELFGVAACPDRMPFRLAGRHPLDWWRPGKRARGVDRDRIQQGFAPFGWAGDFRPNRRNAERPNGAVKALRFRSWKPWLACGGCHSQGRSGLRLRPRVAGARSLARSD